ncbi:MAG TPA: SDR family oxidoreductase [Candidatus Binatia bacterium]|nr:SDR family oxidoreductase [Candidatus Binatia bacterium]
MEIRERRPLDRGVCVITGGGRGIGAATARQAASAGWRVCLSWHADRESAEAVADEISGRAVRAEVCQEDEVRALFEAAGEMGPVTAAVANAGIVAAQARLDEMDGGRMRRTLEVNVLGVMLTAREAIRRMSQRHGGGGGSIVTVSSAASRLGSAGEYVDYAASKGAVDSFTIGLAREVAAEGIRVNAVRPGVVETEIHSLGGEPGRAARLAPSIPLGRAARPDEVAAAIVWLLGDEAAYVTGAILDVAGGR